MKTHTPKNANAAAERLASLSRRRFLRGLGACIALPAFDSLGAMRALADTAGAGTAAKAPVKMAFLYVPNGIIPSGWWPEDGAGANFEFPRTLQTLAKVRDQVQIISGLEDLSAHPGDHSSRAHARARRTLL